MRRTIDLHLPAGPEAPAEARRALIDALRHDVPERAIEDLALLVTELVTNSVRHAGLEAGGDIALLVEADSRRVRAEVVDRGRGFRPRRFPADAPAQRGSGWGLYLLERLATRWGVFRQAPTVVWFEIDVDRPREAEDEEMRRSELAGV
jgi:anti-sigma regulatory factor (Ser/Thr protein kinase)